MKTVIISDVHGDYKSLLFLEHIKFDKLIILGDLFGYVDQDNEKIIEILNKYRDKLECLLGNCDSKYLYEHYLIPISIDYVKYEYCSKTIYLTHGHNYNIHKLSFYGNNNIIIYGHEHIPYIENIDSTIYICVGSIAKPRYKAEKSYLLIENNYIFLVSDNGIIDSIKID